MTFFRVYRTPKAKTVGVVALKGLKFKKKKIRKKSFTEWVFSGICQPVRPIRKNESPGGGRKKYDGKCLRLAHFSPSGAAIAAAGTTRLAQPHDERKTQR